MQITKVLIQCLTFASFVGTLAIALSQITWTNDDSDDDFDNFFDTYEEENEKRMDEAESKDSLQVVPVKIGDAAV